MNRFANAVLWLMSVWAAALGAGLQGAPWDEAERRYSEGAFTLAHDAYQRLSTNGLPPADQRWVLFRRQDAAWRAAVAGPDTAPVEQAERALKTLAPEDAPSAARDRVWREVWESLGDLEARRGARERVAHAYGLVLEAWAASTDLDIARDRFLGILWKWNQPPHYGRGFAGFGAEIPLPWLDNAVAIARKPADVARAHRLRAFAASNSGNAERQRVQVGEDFEAALAVGRADPDHDETLIRYADWLAAFGRFQPLPDGAWRREGDSNRALAVYRRLISEFKKGQTRHWEAAESRVMELTAVSVRLAIPGVYLPGSEIRFDAVWRNTSSIRFRIFPVDLARDLRFSDPRVPAGAWIQQLRSEGARVVQEWTLETHDAGEHQEGSREVLVSPRLAPGAYLIEATAGSVVTREVILVSDLTLVVRSIAGRTLVWAVDAVTGRPQPGASVRFWVHAYSTGPGSWSAQDRITGPDGIADFQHALPMGAEYWIAARAGARQAVSMGWAAGRPSPDDSWKIHSLTDRPVYRPGDPVHWKIIARRMEAGELVTPGGRAVWIGFFDAQGGPLTNSTVTLNAFGSGSGTVTTGAAAPLGLYRMQVRDSTATGRILGEAVLFRLEEYKLPEFEVTVQSPVATNSVPGQGAPSRGVRPGERIPIEIRAAYYFGGPVANAEVEVRIRRRTFQWTPPWDPEVPWLHRDPPEPRRGTLVPGKQLPMIHEPGIADDEELKRETLHTDAEGRLTLWIDTEATWGDVELSVEARVVDASRREVVGRGHVRATRQSYQVAIRPSARAPRPGDTVRLSFRSQDASAEPVAAEGVMHVAREVWWEVWLDSLGNEVSGTALKRVREQSPIWPPRPAPGMCEWRLKSSGYRREELPSSPVKLGTNGRTEAVFRPDREGFYRISWEGPDRADPKVPEWRPVVRAETLVWVATKSATDLGYASSSGLEIIPSVDTVRPGEMLPFLVTGPRPDRWVLLTLCTDQLLGHRVVHLVGTTARMEWPITEAMAPNAWLGASLVNDRALLTDEKELTVPPASHVMSVDLRPDAVESGPRTETGMTITTRDASGRPVSAEVALSVFDESVLQLQTDLAGDLRSLFLDRRHARGLQPSSSFDQRPFLRYVRARNGSVYEERERLEFDADGNPVNVPTPGLMTRDLARSEAAGALRPATAMRLGLAGGGRERFLAKGMTTPRQIVTGALIPTADVGAGGSPDSEPDPSVAAVVVRSDFRATAFWQSEIRTGSDGTARVTVRYPESLTRWQAVAQAATTGNLFGREQLTTRTVQPLVARLEIPRFLVVGDSATVSAIVHNHTTNEVRARVRLKSEGVDVAADPDSAGRLLVLAPGGEARTEWTVRASKAGSAVFRLTAAGGAVSDGVEQSIRIEPHGLVQQFVRSGKATNELVTVHVTLPQRAPGSERLEVQVTPSLALTLLDALPYLADFPYACTEQTLSRFLPAVVVRQTLKTVGIDAEAAMSRTFGGISTNAAGTVSPSLGPRRDLSKLDSMTRAGLERLVDFQKEDGSWGWWKEGSSDAWMTAYVSWGLKQAMRAGVPGVDEAMWHRADAWLVKHLVDAQEDPALQIWMLQALLDRTSGSDRNVSARAPELQSALERLWPRRKELSAYSRALLAGVFHRLGDRERAETVVWSLPDGAVWDTTPDASVILGATGTGGLPSVHWGRDEGWFRWEEGAVETTSAVLRALIQVDPANSMIEPAVHWLLKNRRGMQWSNTRDSALAILALNDFLEVSGELKGSLEVSVSLNGRELGRRSITPESVLAPPMVFHAEGGPVGGANEVRIVRHAGKAPIYFSVNASCFTIAEPVPAGGNDLYVRREYHRLVPEPTLLRGVAERLEPVSDGASIHAGDRLEEVVLVESRRDLEYVLLQDLKPAGFEAEALRSGGSLWLREVNRPRGASALTPLPPGEVTEVEEAGRSAWAHPEWRDREVAVFVHRLPAGLWMLRYRFRATTPGDFHALPLSAGAMYVPELRGNSAEWRVGIRDAGRP